jgi:hypothetical protein
LLMNGKRSADRSNGRQTNCRPFGLMTGRQLRTFR